MSTVTQTNPTTAHQVKSKYSDSHQTKLLIEHNRASKYHINASHQTQALIYQTIALSKLNLIKQTQALYLLLKHSFIKAPIYQTMA